MKKAVVVLAAALLILSLGAASLAAPVAPKGITTTALTDFTALEDGEKDPSGNEGDLSMVAYTVAAFAGLGGVAFARKRK